MAGILNFEFWWELWSIDIWLWNEGVNTCVDKITTVGKPILNICAQQWYICVQKLLVLWARKV